jgi:hypothetical protein
MTHTTFRDILPRVVRLTLATSPAALQLKLDGQPVATPFSFDSVVGILRTLDAATPQTSGGTTYQFVSWSDGGAAAHDVSTPAAATTYTASYSAIGWPNEPGGRGQGNDQPWDELTGNGWSWLRRASSQGPSIVADTTAPLSPPNVLQMVFTPDMGYGNEPSVHWTGLPWVEEIYTGWWIKLSPNWTCSLGEWCTHVTYLFARDGVGQVYTAYYHPSEDQAGPPYRIGANTEWAPSSRILGTPTSPRRGCTRGNGTGSSSITSGKRRPGCRATASFAGGSMAC